MASANPSHPLALPRQFVRMCRRNAHRQKVVDSTGVRLTGRELLLRSLALRRILLREVLRTEDGRLGLLLPPSVAGLLANVAVTLAGRIPVNLSYTLGAETINACLRQAGIRRVLTSRRVLERFPLQLDAELLFLEDLREKATVTDKLAAALQALVMPTPLLERWLGLTKIRPSDLLTIIFTSGSTGAPKGVMLSYENVRSNIEAVDEVSRLRPDDIFLGVLPLFHAFGFTCTVWAVCCLDVGCAYHFNPLDAQLVGKLCRTEGVTFMIGTPTLLRAYLKRCAQEDFPALNVVVCGAERLSPTLAEAFEQKFGVRPVEGYGCTECSPLAAVNVPPTRARDPRLHRMKEGTVGRALPGVSLKIVDLDSGADLPAGQAGMLLVRGPNVMQGYLGLPQATAEALRDGWYVTGDVAVMDNEGFVTLTGRLSRFSKIGGEMAPHVLIEETLAKAIGGDEDELAAVVTAVPDGVKGERLVVLHKALQKPVIDLCRYLSAAGLPNLWIPSPDSFHEVESLPLLSTGKVDLLAVQRMAREQFGG